MPSSVSFAHVFKKATAVVTGAASGIGRELAVELAHARARIVLADVDEVGLEETARRVVRAHGHPTIVSCDVRDPAAVEELARRTEAAIGVPELAIFNAGVMTTGEILETDLASIDRVFDVNFRGVVHGDRSFVPRMLERGRGRVVHVASLAGFVSAPYMGAYAASKAAVVAWSEALYAEVGHRGIAVTVCCPSFTRTPFVARGDATDEATRAFGQAWLDFMGSDPVDVARAALSASARRELYAVPTVHGNVTWRLKRLAPAGLVRGLGLAHRARQRMASPSPT
jgi:short-subunit dehydrogenase